MSFINWNGKIVSEDQVLISPDNRSFRYGYGCFETIKVINKNIILADLHFQRLFSSLDVLQFKVPTALTSHYLAEQIKELITANNHQATARVRLTIYGGDGSINDAVDDYPNFIIQSWPLSEEVNQLNKRGLKIELYAEAKKSFDKYSFIKSNSFLPYVMGAKMAGEKKLDDCILCNAFGRIADATTANVFIVSDGIIKTPAITEGCIDGTIRNHLLRCFKRENIPFHETEIQPDELLNASEVFLTNAITGISWVASLNNSNYVNEASSYLHEKFIKPLYNS